LKKNISTIGKVYKATFEVWDYQSGTVRIKLGGAGLTGEGNLASANGIYTQYINSDGVDLYIQGRSSFVGSVDNISVKEVGQHWTFGTGWSTDGTKAISAGSNEDAYLSQSGIVPGRTYKVTFDVNDYTSGALSVRAVNEA